MNVTMVFMAKTAFLRGYVEEFARRDIAADIYGLFLSGEITRETAGIRSIYLPMRIQRVALAMERIGKKFGRSSLGRYVGVHGLSRRVMDKGALRQSDVLFCQPYFWPLVKAAKKAGLSVLLECDSAYPQDLWDMTRKREKINNIPRRMAEPWNFLPYVKMALKSIQIADKIITLNEFASDSYLRRGLSRDKICALKLPLTTPVGRCTAEVGEPRFVFAANRAIGKGLDIVLAAWRSYCTQGGRGQLQICGEETPAFQLIYSRFEPLARVSRMGHVALDKLFASQRCVLLSPSFSEAGPRTVLEAMAAGNPVVASKAGSADMVEPGVTGWLIQPTADGVLQGLMEVDKHWQEIGAYGELALKRVEEERGRGQYFRSVCDVLVAMARHANSYHISQV
jgi:glycosyltransferase involved in cell wall biosynthesis